MKITHIIFALCFFTLSLFTLGCDPEPLPDETIQLDNISWKYSQKSALVRFGGTPSYRDIYVKIDGEEGSYLYLILPIEYMDSIPSMPYEVVGRAAYYSNSAILTEAPSEGAATIQLLGIDASNKTLRLAFETVVQGQGSVKKHFKSGEISAIDFKEANMGTTLLDYEVKKDQIEWHISEMGSDMHYGQVNWFFYNSEAFPEVGTIYFQIPWGQSLGTQQISADGELPIYYTQGAAQWVLESAEITLEENSFPDARQKGRFKGVFHHPNFPDQKFEVSEARFEVSFRQ